MARFPGSLSAGSSRCGLHPMSGSGELPLAPLARTVRLEYLHRFEFAAEAVYGLIADFGGTRLTRGYVARVETEGAGVGMRRTFHLEPRVGRGYVIEELTLLDPVRRAVGFRMVDNGELPWSGYEGYAQLTPRGPSRSILYAWVSFVVDEPDAERFAVISRQNYALFFANIENVLREG